MRGIVRSGVFVTLVAAMTACASTGPKGTTTHTENGSVSPSGAPADGARASAPKRDANILRRTEVGEAQLNMSAYEVVQQERPRFFSSGTNTMSGNALVVYVDGAQMGGAPELKNIRMSEVEEIRYLSGSEATNRFGTGHLGGAILVKRRR